MFAPWIHEPQGHRHSELERHVESGEIIGSFSRASRQIMNGIPAAGQGTYDAIQTRLGNSAALKSAPRYKTATHGSEDNRVKQGRIVFVERAIDEYRLGRIERQRSLPEVGTWHLLWAHVGFNRRIIRLTLAQAFGSLSYLIKPVLPFTAILVGGVRRGLISNYLKGL